MPFDNLLHGNLYYENMAQTYELRFCFELSSRNLGKIDINKLFFGYETLHTNNDINYTKKKKVLFTDNDNDEEKNIVVADKILSGQIYNYFDVNNNEHDIKNQILLTDYDKYFYQLYDSFDTHYQDITEGSNKIMLNFNGACEAIYVYFSCKDTNNFHFNKICNSVTFECNDEIYLMSNKSKLNDFNSIHDNFEDENYLDYVYKTDFSGKYVDLSTSVKCPKIEFNNTLKNNDLRLQVCVIGIIKNVGVYYNNRFIKIG